MLDATDALLATLRRSLTQSERLIDRAVNGVPVTLAEEAGVRGEIERTRAIERMDAMLTLRRQHLRPM